MPHGLRVDARIFRLIAIAGSALVLAGCITARPMTLGLVEPASTEQRGEIIARGVTATDCPDPGYMYGDYNDAVTMALATVEGADALVNVTFEIKDTFGHYCLRVTGDAVAL